MMEENIVEEIRKFVEEECKKPTSKYGYAPYKFHFIPVVKFSKQLAEKLGADREVVELAAWLHDIGSIIHGRKDHHITGAEIAEKKLREFNYPEDKIKLIKKCILNHRGSVENGRESTEEKIIADADSMSHFENLGGIFQAALMFEELDQLEAQESVLNKLLRSFKKLSLDESRELIRDKYEAAIILLK